MSSFCKKMDLSCTSINQELNVFTIQNITKKDLLFLITLHSKEDFDKISVFNFKQFMKTTSRESLMQDYQVIRVEMKKSNIEGECLIENITLLRMNKSKFALAIFLSLITAGIFLLLLRWFFKLRKSFLYMEVFTIQESTHILIRNSDGTQTVERIEKISLNLEHLEGFSDDGIYSFQNRKLRYVYTEDQNQIGHFQALEYPVCNQSLRELKEKSYLDAQQVIVNKEAYGKCEKIIDIPSLPYYLFKEMTTPFFFLQYISIVLWIFENYISFTIIMFSVSLAITILNYILMRISLVKIQKMAHAPDNVAVLRKDSNTSFRESIKLIKVVNQDIVVGDIILLQDKQILPCDCVLIAGETLMNEVSLTGESLPIPKYPLQSSEEKFSYAKEFKQHILFEGTEIFQCKGDENKQVLARVIRVGFSSFKGQILRSVLYPKPIKFEYYSNAMKYILGLLAVVLVIYFSRIYEMYKLDFPKQFYFYRFFDTVTWIIPPFLPIFVSLSQTLALMRLRLFDVYGIDPQKTFISGKVTHMCFDKTGTLTQNGMNVSGYYNENLKEVYTIENMEGISRYEDIQYKLFSTCHGAYLINDSLVGDMLDIEMLKFSGYNIQNAENDINIKFKASHPKLQNELQVLKVFEFSSDLQRMSCLTYDVTNNKHYFFLKGAPEKVQELCQASSIPKNFQDLQNNLSLKGFRIIAMAYKDIKSRDEGLLSAREKLEVELKFLGFLILENKLKEDTAEAIMSLKEAHIECKIISGDNPLTTLQTGIECGILNPNSKIFYVDQEYHELKLYKVENEQIETYQPDKMSKIQILKALVLNEEQLVITGKVLDFFYSYIKNINNVNVMQPPDSDSSIDDYISIDEKSINVSRGSNPTNKFDLCKQLILNTVIFSRMRPEQKRIIIEMLQNQGLKVGMIGDGANDCAAIKQGDIGISFATADAAFSAPFSSRNDSIKCVERILLEGRCTMTVNIEIFRTIVTQNVMKYIGVMVLLQEASNFGGFQYTFLSFLCGMPLLVYLAFSLPQQKLQPYTPDDRFFGMSNSLSMYSQFIIFGFAFLVGYWILTSQSWHVVISELDENDGLLIYNMQGELNSVIFLMINVFYISSCVSYYISYPYKQIIFRNYFLLSFVILSLTYGILIILMPEYSLSGLLIAESLSDHSTTMVYIFITVVVASALVLCIEEFIIKKYFGPKKIKKET